MAQQITLPVQLPDGEIFSTFHGNENQQLIHHLERLARQKVDQQTPIVSYIHGDRGCGKSHLLFSVCHEALINDIPHIYIGLKQIADLSVDMLDGLENMGVICIDDIEQLKGHADWQVGIFDLINRVIENGRSFILFSANTNPKRLAIELDDLRSRLVWGITFSVKAISESNKAGALINRAEHRGMHMPDEVANFLMTHVPRDMKNLIKVLDRLDTLSLQEKRKLTVPFVKSALQL